jgi:hypothetical protein
MRKFFIILFFLLGSGALFAQELNCGVTINTQQLKTTDPKVFTTLQTSITEFMNTRKWTSDVFQPEEKIDCEIVITITEEVASDRFKAQASIISRRPVFGTDYNTVMLNTIDKDWEFQYVEYQALEFNEALFMNNLTSMLAYYAYIIIGLDYDSFTKKGGDIYYQKAYTIVSQASNREEAGWKSFDGNRNRYWLVNNITDPRFAGMRDVYYQYHRLGLDRLSEDRVKPLEAITKSLQTMDNINRSQPNSMIIQLFFSAKSTEVQGLYSKALPNEKSKAVSYLMRLDPLNAEKYQALLSGN